MNNQSNIFKAESCVTKDRKDFTSIKRGRFHGTEWYLPKWVFFN